jgi:hypothetical protein
MDNFSITLSCMFCDAELQGDTTIKYNDGDLITCQNCGMENDYTSLIEIAKEKALEICSSEIQNELNTIFKKFK